MLPPRLCFSLFFFNDTATTEIYTLSLHDALPIYLCGKFLPFTDAARPPAQKKHPSGEFQAQLAEVARPAAAQHLDALFDLERIASLSAERLVRSEEHTSELQSPCNLVCRLLLEKKKNTYS